MVLALTTSARIGELLALRWEHCQDGYVTFWETKNGKARRIPISPAIAAVLAAQPGIYPSVFANSRTGQPRPPTASPTPSTGPSGARGSRPAMSRCTRCGIQP